MTSARPLALLTPWLACLLVACGGDGRGDPPPADGGRDTATVDGGEDAGADTGSPAEDGGAALDGGTPGEDAGAGDAGAGEDAGAGDAGAGEDAGAVDAGPVVLGPVQCRVDSDCGGSLTCNRAAPGGVCLGCSDVLLCPGVLDCGDGFAACVRDCTDDSDCNAGFRCSTSGCAVRRCDADDECPGPYVCNTSARLCERPTCDTGTPCPSPLLCSAGRCVEPE